MKDHLPYLVKRFSIFRKKRDSQSKEREKRCIANRKFDAFLSPDDQEKLDETLTNLTLKYQKVFTNLDMEKSYEGLFQVLWHSTNPCFDIQNWTSEYKDQKSSIKKCIWKGVDVMRINWFEHF